MLGANKRAVYQQQLTDAATKATRAAEEGSESFKRAFFKGIGSSEWGVFLAAARRLAQIESEEYPRDDDHCLLCHRPLDAESTALIRRFWDFLASPVVREAEQARATVDRSVRSLARLQPAFFAPETRVYRHITRLNPVLAKQIEELVEMLETARRAIADVLAAGQGEIAPVALADVSGELNALKNQIDADIARLQEQDVAEALKSLEADRVLLNPSAAASKVSASPKHEPQHRQANSKPDESSA